MIAHRPESGGGGKSQRPSPPGAGDDSFDFRWLPDQRQATSAVRATSGAWGSGASSAAQIARRDDAENKIVIALTIACTLMALVDLFLLASGI
jgi:hypothetical protein